MLVLSLKNGNDDPARVSFRKILHSIGRNQPFDSIIELLIINLFFDQPVTKNKMHMKKFTQQELY